MHSRPAGGPFISSASGTSGHNSNSPMSLLGHSRRCGPRASAAHVRCSPKATVSHQNASRR